MHRLRPTESAGWPQVSGQRLNSVGEASNAGDARARAKELHGREELDRSGIEEPHRRKIRVCDGVHHTQRASVVISSCVFTNWVLSQLLLGTRQGIDPISIFHFGGKPGQRTPPD